MTTFQPLSTVTQVLDALGGVRPVANMFGESYNTVYNWKLRQKFPAKTRDFFAAELASKRFVAPRELWGMR